MRTVELLCDPHLDATVREAWRRLAAAGLPSLATHRGPTNRPHVTLGAADTLPDLGFVVRALPVPVFADDLVFFDGKSGVAAWRLGSTTLRAVQAAVWRALGGVGNPLHDPAAWTPHISLARRVRPDQRRDVEQALDGLGTVEGLLIAARSYDTGTRTVTELGA
ncbi:2'-5' RNA ligase family protein [Spirilliplanes yamanashiensis]|uniref:2'-5' RNA ligase n=1 Tax=Spirilliplanes yamanashiensis TaxID=42233 RepID=A0A8J4DG77_9ACTN|nr:2'-5' RNA ligase family protein [Spirilliplanes yamanashiensis]MDP9814049.1 hypothetical protein [Spirilliplanes yamanashiensis]GIJ00971.1 hypothetical protein Sya03_03230 [Spirilliplanes yamanashiensis]